MRLAACQCPSTIHNPHHKLRLAPNQPQGDKEREQGLPISPLCDRHGGGISRSQQGFFTVVVLPLLANFTHRFKPARPFLEGAVSNYLYWRDEELARKQQQQQAEEAAGRKKLDL